MNKRGDEPMNYYIADLHLGHENVLRHDGRPFENAGQMNAELIRRWNDRVSDSDHVYILGDFAWKNSLGLEVLRQLAGHKFFILGNFFFNLCPINISIPT